MTYYLKYRSKNLGELDLEDVRVSLESIVKSGNIPHALLFSGPKGTGKTSAARIIAKIVNCEHPLGGGEPCNKCSQCISIAKGENLDVLELDAASHRGIDDIRSLREAVKLNPIKANKKIYIIDEAHMLTTEASNALLKTLEEPPEHVMFILATTNPEKLIETIRSRVTEIYFNKAKVPEIVRSLKRVVKSEKLKTDDGVLMLIAESSDGSFRDAIKTLEQLVNEKIRLNIAGVEKKLLQKNIFIPEDFLDILIDKNVNKALVEIDKYVKGGVSVRYIISEVILILRESLVKNILGEESKKINLSQKDLVYLIETLSDAYSRVPYSVMEQIPLELAVIKWCEGNVKTQNSKVKSEDEKETKETVKELKQTQKLKTDNEKKADKISEHNDISSKPIKNLLQNSKGCIEETIWAKILSQIRPINTSTEALLRASRPIEYDGKVLKLAVYYKFHKEHLESNPHIHILEKVAADVLGNSTRVICTLTKPPIRPKDDQFLAEKKQENTAANQSSGEVNKNVDLDSTKPDLVLTESEDADIIKVAKEIFGS